MEKQALQVALKQFLNTNQDQTENLKLIIENAQLGHHKSLFTLLKYYKRKSIDEKLFKKYLEIALKYHPKDTFFLTYLSECYYNGICYEMNQYKAITILEGIEKKTSREYLQIGKYYHKLKDGPDIESAIKYYKLAVDSELECSQKLGEIYLQGYQVPQDVELALEYFQKSLSFGNTRVLNNIGECLIELKRYNEAREILEKGKKTLIQGYDVLSDYCKTNLMIIDSLTNLPLFLKLAPQLENSPKSFYINYKLGYLFYQVKNYGKAKYFLLKTQLMSISHEYLTKTEFFLGNMICVEKLLSQYCTNNPLFAYEVNAYLYMKDSLEKSIQLYSQANPHLGLDTSLSLPEQWFKILEKKYKESKDYIHHKILKDYITFKDDPKLKIQYSKAFEKPTNVMLAFQYSNIKDYEMALHHYQLAIKDGLAKCHYDIALIYHYGSTGTKNNSLAKEYFMKYRFTKSYYYLGKIYFMENNYKEAIKFFEMSDNCDTSRKFLKYLKNQEYPEPENNIMIEDNVDKLIQSRSNIDKAYKILKEDEKNQEQILILRREMDDLKAQYLLELYIKNSLSLNGIQALAREYPEANVLLIIYYYDYSQMEMADEYLKKILNYPEALFELGKFYYKKNNRVKALEIFNLIKDEPTSFYYLGSLYLSGQTKNVHLGVQYLIKSKHPLSLTKIGKYYFERGIYDKAEHFILLNSNKDDAHQILGLLFLKINNIPKTIEHLTKSQTSTSKFELGKIYLYNQQYFDLKMAEEMFKGIEDYSKHHYLGLIYFKMNDITNAFYHLKKSVISCSEKSYYLAQIYSKDPHKDLTLAYNHFMISFKANNQNAGYEAGMMLLFGEGVEKNISEALAIFDQITDSNLLYQIGMVFYKDIKNITYSIIYLEKSKEIDASFKLAEIYFQFKEYQKARKNLLLTIGHYPKSYYYLAKLETNLEKSLESLHKGDSLGCYDCTFALGIHHFEVSKLGEEYFLKCLMNGNKEAKEYLGKIYFHQKNYEKAKIYLLDVFDNGNSEVAYFLAEIELSEGELEKAIYYHKISIELGNDNSLLSLINIYQNHLNDNENAYRFIELGVERMNQECLSLKVEYLMQGKYLPKDTNEIKELLSKAFGMEPTPKIILQFGLFFASQKIYGEARRYFEMGKNNLCLLSTKELIKLEIQQLNLQEALDLVEKSFRQSNEYEFFKSLITHLKKNQLKHHHPLYAEVRKNKMEKQVFHFLDQKSKREVQSFKREEKMKQIQIKNQEILNIFKKIKKVVKK